MAKDGKGKAASEAKTAKKAVETAAKAPAEAKPVKPAEAKPTAEIKVEAPVKAEPKKVEPQSVETKSAAPKKEAEPAAAKKTAGRPKKAVKEPVVPELFVQYTDDPAGEQEANVSDIITKVKAAYVAEGHRESSIKTLRIYMKPQEWKAYYVINNKIEGNIDLF